MLDGACEVDTVMNRMVELKMPAAAITDHGNLFGAVSFYETAKKKGIKPIIGCEVYVARGSHTERTSVEGEKANHHLVLLCENNTGYKNLVKLVSHGYLQGFYYKPRVDKELLAKHSEGLILRSNSIFKKYQGSIGLKVKLYILMRCVFQEYIDKFFFACVWIITHK